MKCIIDGAYGFNNVGDEAMLSTASRVISETSSDVEVVVSSYLPHRITGLHGLKSTNYLLLGTLVRSLLRLDIPAVIEQVKYFKTIDLLVFAGGSILNDSKGLRSILVILYKVILSRIFNFGLIFWGVSIGPIKTKTGHKIISWILNKSDLVILRDENSTSMARQMISASSTEKVISGVDILFSLNNGESIEKNERPLDKSDKLRVGLSLRPYPPIVGENEKDLDDLLVTQVSRLCVKISDSYDVTFVPLIFSEGEAHKDDMGILQRVIDMSPCVKFEAYNASVSEITDQSYTLYLSSLVDSYKKLDLVIGERFHSLVISQLLAVPYIGLSYDAKIDGLAKYSSTEKYIVDFMSELHAEQLDCRVFEIFTEIIKNNVSFANNIKILHQAESDRHAIKSAVANI